MAARTSKFGTLIARIAYTIFFVPLVILGVVAWLENRSRRNRLKRDEENAVLKSLSKGRCPDCGEREFYMGPQGGLCQNIACGNDNCGSRFNVAPFDDGWCGPAFLAERLSEPSPKKPKAEVV